LLRVSGLLRFQVRANVVSAKRAEVDNHAFALELTRVQREERLPILESATRQLGEPDVPQTLAAIKVLTRAFQRGAWRHLSGIVYCAARATHQFSPPLVSMRDRTTDISIRLS
jgi:hypothetical protein